MFLRAITLAFLSSVTLTACETAPTAIGLGQLADARDTRIGRQDFAQVVARVEPVAEQICRDRTSRLNCDFRFVVDDRPRVPSNAFVTLDEQRNDQPTIVVTLALIDEMRNVDEMAFVLSHEAAHHIREHFRRQAENAQLGAEVFGRTAGAAGATTQAALDAAAQLGALVGSRTYSRDFELEADELGTRIAAQAGYNPVIGAQFFFRIPDPGDVFLGTHPPNQQRVDIVNQTASALGFPIQ